MRVAAVLRALARRRVVRGSVMAAAIGLCALAVWIAWPLPDALARPQPVSSVTLLDRNGLPLRTTRSPAGERGGWVSIQQIDADVIRAFVAAEDRRFYQHHGVDARALARAARDAITQRRIVSGASTLTMQTARLLRGTRRTLTGKLSQILWALRLDAHLDKNEILERYLNRVPLGEGTVGVAAAAARYFEATATELSIGQAALLAGLAGAPARDNPVAAPQRARARRALVLSRMQRLGYITESDVERAAAEPVQPPAASARFLAPHFTTRVLRRLEPSATRAVRTTLDLELQTALEAEVRHTVATLRERTVRHAAVVVLDNASGDVLAWVGSPDFFADTAGQVDMVVSPRQPGSTLKPFLYGLAFERGFTAASVLPDVPRTYATTTGPYQPQNYDRRFRGPVRAREALASSYNVPAVELAERLSAGALLRTLHDAGFASLQQSAEHYGLGLALGNGDVTLLELANAYRGLANGGVWRPAGMPEESKRVREEERRFLSATSAALVLDILADPIARIPGFGVETPLDFPFRTATKTGTSRHFTDNWAVATTANFTVAVWVGNFSGRPMQGVSGISGAGPLLYRSVLQTAQRYSPGRLVHPEQAGLLAAPVCILSGMRATPTCPSIVEWFVPGTEPGLFDTWQTSGKMVLPPEYGEWVASTTARAPVTLAANTVTDTVTSAPRIISPLDGDHFEQPVDVDPRFATIALLAGGDAARVCWSVDGHAINGTRWQIEKGTHVIRAVWPSGARDSVRIVVE
ncbi:MAG: penicillin-binding protein 1C [Longimicrobiales bacterium]